MKKIIWECKAKVIREHILYTFCFQNVKTESWDGVARWRGGGLMGHDIFSSASQVGLNYFSDFYSWISSKFLFAGSLHDIPKGKSRSFLLKCDWAGKDDAHYLSLPHLPLRNLRTVFSLTGRSVLLLGIWHCFLIPAAFLPCRSVGQNKPCKQGGDALQEEKADLKIFGFPKCLG